MMSWDTCRPPEGPHRHLSLAAFLIATSNDWSAACIECCCRQLACLHLSSQPLLVTKSGVPSHLHRARSDFTSTFASTLRPAECLNAASTKDKNGPGFSVTHGRLLDIVACQSSNVAALLDFLEARALLPVFGDPEGMDLQAANWGFKQPQGIASPSASARTLLHWLPDHQARCVSVNFGPGDQYGCSCMYSLANLSSKPEGGAHACQMAS